MTPDMSTEGMNACTYSTKMQSDEQQRMDYGITDAEIGLVMDNISVLEARWHKVSEGMAKNIERIHRVNRHDPSGLERALRALPDLKTAYIQEIFKYDPKKGFLEDEEATDSPHVIVDMNLETGILHGTAHFFLPPDSPIPEGESREERMVIMAIESYNISRRIEYESAQRRKAGLRQDTLLSQGTLFQPLS